jgi:hypothetical protein
MAFRVVHGPFLRHWMRNRTIHCVMSGPLLFGAGVVFLLHDAHVLWIRPGLIWLLLLAGLVIAFLVEIGMAVSARRED